ncbi:trypsin-like serine peptidase [Actinomadura gamaensis]|uniref:Trypsin-like serine peptidase n=1 Tax=Actinomadura gamaensis TaxID=1763541 RepID=A0ABV9TUF2_9ACTN
MRLALRHRAAFAGVAIGLTVGALSPAASASPSPAPVPGLPGVVRLPVSDAESDAALKYWTQARMDSAVPADLPEQTSTPATGRMKQGGGPSTRTNVRTSAPPAAPTAITAKERSWPTNGIPTVGALFFNVGPIHQRCTGTVVNTPKGNIIATAAHCIWRKDVGIPHPNPNPVFVPGYYSGHSPYGKWAVKSRYITTEWHNHFNPDHDFGFMVMKPNHGKNLQPLLGANGWKTSDQYYQNYVEITGYPGNRNRPYQCYTHTRQAKNYIWQLVFGCDNYHEGVSGSLLMLDFHTTGPLRNLGTAMASLGGYKEGGTSDNTSYAVIWNHATAVLLDAAVRKQ